MVVGEIKFYRVFAFKISQIFFFTGVSVLVVLGHRLLNFPNRWGLDPTFAVEVIRTMGWESKGLPFGAIAALGSALAIFLAFRNSSAYDRWWEARKIWGAMVNDSRSWCRQALTFIDSDVATSRALIHRHLAFANALRMHLRQEAQLLLKLSPYLSKEETTNLSSRPNIPTALLLKQGQELAGLYKEGRIDGHQFWLMDQMLTRLSDIQGKCERIKNTPVPRHYDVIPRWFVYFYGCILPFGLASTLGWASVPLCVSITVLFSLLENAGRLIEDPFEGRAMDTPMTALCITIERDLRASLGETLPEPARPDDAGVVM